MADFSSFPQTSARRSQSFDGWWQARAANLGGVRLPDDVLPGLAMLMFNRTLYLGNDVCALDIDARVIPSTVDLLIVRGPNRWRFIPGIFQVSGRRLRLCLDLSGQQRPEAFVVPFGSRFLLLDYERAPGPDVEPILRGAVRDRRHAASCTGSAQRCVSHSATGAIHARDRSALQVQNEDSD
jgi:uncharacterized protein (TIGR03067 family)